jgi:hypothetical protein
MSPLADACPKCFPGDYPASLPLEVTEEPGHPGSLRASYRCTQGHSWVCWWDAGASGWPVTRTEAAA